MEHTECNLWYGISKEIPTTENRTLRLSPKAIFLWDSKEYNNLFQVADSTEKRDKFHLVKCNNCGLIWLNPRLSIDELRRIYSDNYQGINPQESSFNSFYKFGKWIESKFEKLLLMEDIRLVEKYRTVVGFSMWAVVMGDFSTCVG